MSEIRNCAKCGWPRYRRGKGRHVATGGTMCVSCKACWAPPRARAHTCGLADLQSTFKI